MGLQRANKIFSINYGAARMEFYLDGTRRW